MSIPTQLWRLKTGFNSEGYTFNDHFFYVLFHYYSAYHIDEVMFLQRTGLISVLFSYVEYWKFSLLPVLLHCNARALYYFASKLPSSIPFIFQFHGTRVDLTFVMDGVWFLISTFLSGSTTTPHFFQPHPFTSIKHEQT